MKSDKINFRGKQVAVFTNENKGATPIVFIHGNSMSSKIWKKQFDSFLNDKYYLIAYDMMGMGASEHSGPEDYSLPALKECLKTVINYYELRDYYVVGHSLGGHIAVQALEELDSCKGIFTIAAPPIALPPNIGEIYLSTAPLNVMFEKEYTDSGLEAVVNNFFHTATNVPEFFESDFRGSDGTVRQSIAAILGSNEFKNEVEVLKNSNLSKAFVSGEYEGGINNSYYDTLNFSNTWGEKLNLIPNVAHCPQWENPDALNNLLDRFIQS